MRFFKRDKVDDIDEKLMTKMLSENISPSKLNDVFRKTLSSYSKVILTSFTQISKSTPVEDGFTIAVTAIQNAWVAGYLFAKKYDIDISKK